MFSTLFPTSFIQKRLLGAGYDQSMEQKNHLYSILENFQIYDVSLIEEATEHIFKHFYNLCLPENIDIYVKIQSY